MLGAGLGALMIDTIILKRTIHRFMWLMALAADFSVILIQMWDSSAVESETKINGNLAPSEGTCNFNTRFPRWP
jgi:hypothetical protein